MVNERLARTGVVDRSDNMENKSDIKREAEEKLSKMM
jgi:hypothetical protein